jgi:hypothetical protein
MDEFGLDLADGRLGQRVVIGVADAAHRGDRAGCGEGVGVADRQILGGFSRSSNDEGPE